MKLNQTEIKNMKDSGNCPCCSKKLTNLEITHLAGGNGTTAASEAFRPFRPGNVFQVDANGDLDLTPLRLSESGTQDEQTINAFESIMRGNRKAAEFAAKGRY